MPGDLPVGRFVVLDRGRNAACFAQAVNLDHIGRDTGLHRLPDIRCDQDTCKPKAGERDKTPVSRLHARGADTLVPELAGRSEERRVGKACVSTCRSRWSTYHYKKKTKNKQTKHNREKQ